MQFSPMKLQVVGLQANYDITNGFGDSTGAGTRAFSLQYRRSPDDDRPRAGDRPARKPFYFCAANTVVMPTDFVVGNLTEFAAALKRVTIHSIHYHFIEVRLRLKLRSNDFSIWLEEDLEMPKLAAQLNRIDIYNSTLDGVREKIVRIVEG